MIKHVITYFKKYKMIEKLQEKEWEKNIQEA